MKGVREVNDFRLKFPIHNWETDTQRMIETIEKIKKQYPDAAIAVEAQFETLIST